MGHLVGKDIYRKLGKKVDGLTVRVPWSETLFSILKELYSTDEADLVVRMPYSLSSLDQIEKATGYSRARLERLIEGLCAKGLVMDIWIMGGYRYIISPMVIGIFEFTMMRTGGDVDFKKIAPLFHSYLQDNGAFYKANCSKGEMVSPLRAIPHESTIDDSDFVEILDYEKASAIIEEGGKYAIGICSCRHEKMHAGEKQCDVPLETCSTLGPSVDYMVSHGFAKEVSKSEMFDNLERSRELGLVLCADNVKKDVSFICHCCGCCCNVLLGISRFGYPNIVVTSNYIARTDDDMCTGCGTCAEACPINAIEMEDDDNPKVLESMCIGCGVCALSCETESLKLVKREQRVLHPETTFERVILQCLEKGTLQNQLFSNPQSVTHKFMRGLFGGFLKLPPVKKALMSDMFRSTFLKAMNQGAKMQGNGWITEM